jgi:serine/threonine protein kinase
MNPADDDEELGQYLAAYDDALIEGATPAPDVTGPLPANVEAPFRQLQPLLDQLNQFRRPAPQIEVRLQRFHLQRCLGQGGFGIVYLAYDTVLGREVALKLPRLNAFLNPQLRARFLREAQAAARLDHPNLVPLYDAGSEGAVSFLVSAYCPGPTLAAWLLQQTQPVAVRAVAEVVAALARAVQYMHERGLVHRDLKPSNILLHLSSDGSIVPRITDFGLAKL